MTSDQSLSAALELRRWRAERAATEVAWLILIRERLRQGPALTRELGDACGIPAGQEFGRFKNLLLHAGRSCIERAGQTIGPTGHLNIIWRLREPSPGGGKLESVAEHADL